MNDVDEKNSYAGPLLDSRLSSARFETEEDARLLTYLVYGTLRMRNRLDRVIAHIYDGDFGAMATGIRNILRVALYQAMFTGKIPPYAAVDEAVRMTKDMHPGRANLVNAVLRGAIRKLDEIPWPAPDGDPVEYISVVHSHPAWMVSMWLSEIGLEDTLALAQAGNEIPPLTFRVNRLKTDRESVIAACAAEGHEAKPTPSAPDGAIYLAHPGPVREMALFRRGEVLVQDEASQLIAHLVDPKRGDTILDLCAGAGVKTTHMAALMENAGRIVAVDIKKSKLQELHECARILGAGIIETRVHDATADLGADLHGVFDRILVDVPCSGLGTLRRNPEIRWRLAPGDIDALAVLQKTILTRASRYLKRGGSMVYSTCTISARENEEVVREFIARHQSFRLVAPPSLIENTLVDREGYFRSFPHRHGMDGFFGAVLRKEGE